MALQNTVATISKPNFISTGFCLKLLVELGGKATKSELMQHAMNAYGLSENELQTFGIRLRSLQKARFIELRMSKNVYRQAFSYYIVEEAKPYVQKVMNQE